MSNDTVFDGVIARDEGGRALTFSGIENFPKFIEDFTACMSRLKYTGVITADTDTDEEPLRPDAAFARRDGLAGWGMPTSFDEKLIADYLKISGSYAAKCQVIMASMKNALSTDVKLFLQISFPGYKVATRGNILRMIDLLRNRYGVWSSVLGDRNYYQMKMIPKFTSIQGTQQALIDLQYLKTERDSWVEAPENIYPDSYYREWLHVRMKDWEPIKHLYNTIRANRALTFEQCKLMLLEIITDEIRSAQVALQEKAMLMAALAMVQSPAEQSQVRQPPAWGDSTRHTEFGGDGIVATSAQAHSSQRTGYTRREPHREHSPQPCFNCGIVDHMSYQCREPWCSVCGQHWPSNSHPDYHVYNRCTRTSSTSQLPMMQPARDNNKRSRSPYENSQYKSSAPRRQVTWGDRQGNSSPRRNERFNDGDRSPVRRENSPARKQYPERGTGQQSARSTSGYRAHVAGIDVDGMSNDEIRDLGDRLHAHAAVEDMSNKRTRGDTSPPPFDPDNPEGY